MFHNPDSTFDLRECERFFSPEGEITYQVIILIWTNSLQHQFILYCESWRGKLPLCARARTDVLQTHKIYLRSGPAWHIYCLISQDIQSNHFHLNEVSLLNIHPLCLHFIIAAAFRWNKITVNDHCSKITNSPERPSGSLCDFQISCSSNGEFPQGIGEDATVSMEMNQAKAQVKRPDGIMLGRKRNESCLKCMARDQISVWTVIGGGREWGIQIKATWLVCCSIVKDRLLKEDRMS